jgi:hypothetical protein
MLKEPGVLDYAQLMGLTVLTDEKGEEFLAEKLPNGDPSTPLGSNDTIYQGLR